MKKILIAGSVALAFIIAGCSDKDNVEWDPNATSITINDDGTNNANDGDNSGNSTINNDGSEATRYGDNRNSDSLNSVYFRFDRFDVEGSDNLNTIKNNARVIANTNYEVRVEGNTDEWGSDEYNYALALKRAASVKDALVDNNIPVNRIKLVSYGESKPKCVEKTNKCWQENRRVDFVLVPR